MTEQRRWDPSTFKRIEGKDGRTRLEATTPVCDFCLSTDVKWEYPATNMPLVGHPLVNESEGEWAACDGCKALVDAQKLGPLVERILAGLKSASVPGYVRTKPTPLWRREVRENMLRFFDARTGPARPFQP